MALMIVHNHTDLGTGSTINIIYLELNFCAANCSRHSRYCHLIPTQVIQIHNHILCFCVPNSILVFTGHSLLIMQGLCLFLDAQDKLAEGLVKTKVTMSDRFTLVYNLDIELKPPSVKKVSIATHTMHELSYGVFLVV